MSDDDSFEGEDDNQGIGAIPMPTSYRLNVKPSDVTSTTFSALLERAQSVLAASFELGEHLEMSAQRFSPEGGPIERAEPNDLLQLEETIKHCEVLQGKLQVAQESMRSLIEQDGQQIPFSNTASSSSSSSSSSTSSYLEDLYQRSKQQAAENRQETESQVAAFRKRLEELDPQPEDDSDSDSELRVVSSKATSANCPITGMPMLNPRKSRFCGHHYSLEGAMQLLNQQKQRMRPGDRRPVEVKCPYPGCSQKLREEYLQKDPNYERELASLRRSQARTKSSLSQSQATYQV